VVNDEENIVESKEVEGIEVVDDDKPCFFSKHVELNLQVVVIVVVVVVVVAVAVVVVVVVYF